MVEVLAGDGTRLHVDVVVPHDVHGPTVVFTHGYAQASTCWHHQVEHLAGLGHRIVTWDLRGHGRSARGPADSCTIDVVADDLATVVDAVVPDDDLVMVGHSMGGMALMALAERHPRFTGERVRGICFMSTAARGDHLAWLGLPPRATPRIQRLAGAVFGQLAPHEHAWRLVAWTRPLSSTAVWVSCCGAHTSLADTRRTVAAAHSGGFESMRDFLPSLLAHDRTDALRAWRGRPVLVLNGTADLLIPSSCDDEVAAALPGCRRVRIPGAGHNVMLAAWRRVDAELAALVARAASSSGGASATSANRA